MSPDKRLRILKTAMAVFAKHGYRRVNMKKIACELGISRPGLYLYFKTKEDIFNAVISLFGEMALAKAKAGLRDTMSVEEKLRYAFEVWMVEVFVMNLQSPDAREISESSFEFARDSLNRTYSEFEVLIASILRTRGVSKRATGFSSERIAHLLVSSARGFKAVALDEPDLRKMIHDLIRLSMKVKAR